MKRVAYEEPEDMRPFRETGMAHLYFRKAWEVHLSRNAVVVPKAPFRPFRNVGIREERQGTKDT